MSVVNTVGKRPGIRVDEDSFNSGYPFGPGVIPGLDFPRLVFLPPEPMLVLCLFFMVRYDPLSAPCGKIPLIQTKAYHYRGL